MWRLQQIEARSALRRSSSRLGGERAEQGDALRLIRARSDVYVRTMQPWCVRAGLLDREKSACRRALVEVSTGAAKRDAASSGPTVICKRSLTCSSTPRTQRTREDSELSWSTSTTAEGLSVRLERLKTVARDYRLVAAGIRP